MNMSNPLLTFTDLPPFSQIKPEHIQPAVEQAIADCRAKIEEVLASDVTPSWESIIVPLAETDDRLSRIWSPVSHLNSVKKTAKHGVKLMKRVYLSYLNMALGLVNTKDCTKRINPLKRARRLQAYLKLNKKNHH